METHKMGGSKTDEVEYARIEFIHKNKLVSLKFIPYSKHRELIKKAKQEVFDDIVDKDILHCRTCKPDWEKLKEKHLK